MTMKSHILAALREQFDEWVVLLEGLSAEERARPLDGSSDWTIKDVVAHLYAWQIRSNARLTAALNDATPDLPAWPQAANDDEINAWLYAQYQGLSWDEVYSRWQEGYARLLATTEAIPVERSLFDGERYPWLKGYALADVLLGTYDHHLEHTEALPAWLKARG